MGIWVRQVCFFTLIVTATGSAEAAAGEESADAWRLLRKGKYAEAREIFECLASDDAKAVQGLSQTLAAVGRYDEAIRLLAAAAGASADLHAELAGLALAGGDYLIADTHAEIAIALERNHLLARWVRAELRRLSGQLDEANEAYRWFVRYHNANQVDDPESLRWIGLAAARFARWNRLSEQFSFLVNDLYPRALEVDPDFWPAYYESGRLFLEKHNLADAAKDLKQALKLNPNAAEVHAAVARLALESRDYQQAQQSVERALELNPHLLQAWLTKADMAWANFDSREAAALLDQHALPLNPLCEETLGRLAACYLLEEERSVERPPARFESLVQRVTARNPACGEFFFALACWLEDRHQEPRARDFFHEAIRRLPQMLGPRAHLGMLAMHAGDEHQANEVLDEAFRVDPFNVRVHNMLEVLEVLSGMKTVDTGHCLLKFDDRKDALLAKYVGEYIERIYAELCDEFRFQPPTKPLIEIFREAQGANGQQWFSTRMTGLPYLGTVAASTGKVVAMVSPNDSSVTGGFNWARVIRHEMVHVVTLQKTRFNSPHWYTEALAVWSEGYPRPPRWNELLADRVPEGKLFNLDTINFAFTRAQTSDDWQMAYCQAELYAQYMLETCGSDAIHNLLAAYADNLTTEQAIPRALGVSKEDFEQGYREYLNEVAAGLRGPEEKEDDLASLLAEHRNSPGDPELKAQLALEYLRRDAEAEARMLAEEASLQEPKNELAAYVLARLEVRAGHETKAIERLKACLDPASPNPRILNLLASLLMRAGDFDEAARLYELGVKNYPHDPKWLPALARVHLKSGNDQELALVLGQLARTDPDDAVIRKKLAQMALAAGDFAQAAHWANQALEIDVTEADVHRLLAEARVGHHNYAVAIEEFEIAIGLDPAALETRLMLAKACVEAGDPAKAREVLAALLDDEPNHPGAALLLEKLKESQGL
jgi:tetratricopeptide (TPR) repeat protein